MSASREKQSRKANSGTASPKTAREAQQRREERRTNILYGVIGVVFALAVVAGILWNTGVIARSAAAVTVNGEKYTAAQVSFYYRNSYVNFMNKWYYMTSYLGLDTGASLDSQTIDESAASMIGAEEGITWKEYFVDMALEQIATVQTGLKKAGEEGFSFPDTVQAQLEDSMESLRASAASAGVSVRRYLQGSFGSTMTENAYRGELLRLLQYDAYSNAYKNGLIYTAEDLEAAYAQDPNSYDLVSYESVSISFAVESATDADGSTVEPTEEEEAAAKEAAQAQAEQLLADYKAGGNLESLSASMEDAVYTQEDDASYTGSTVSAWIFDESRESGDTEILESGDNFYVVVFHDRFRDESKTVNVRHILISPESGALSEGDEGYEAEQEELNAAAKAKAEEIYARWQDGEATEESFASLAIEESGDGGSRYGGGLYTNVTEGQMVTEFNDWCFDPARKSGDTGIVETSYGYHIMYYVGDGLPAWEAAADSSLRNDDYQEWFNALSEDADIQRHDFGMRFVA